MNPHPMLALTGKGCVKAAALSVAGRSFTTSPPAVLKQREIMDYSWFPRDV